MSSKLLPIAEVATVKKERPKPPNAGKGRPKGVPNKATGALKEMILGALSKVGGEEYLVRQAEENPTAFLSLIAKVLPTELKSSDPGGFLVRVVTGVPPEEKGEA
ncbi:MAG: hypothetical protein EB060_12035 [Proteobacteria bacterium]|jgi:hypothetical protein|nr:hypothetical protein [Betaproteobacteria bacterium]NDF13527.1 hypothetical protein [Pseudomonadota bacterium]